MAVDPPAAKVRVRMTVAYEGSGFHGFAAQPGVVTVAGALIEALSQLLRHPVVLTAAGRTDSGVHAWGQVVTFDTEPSRFRPEVIQRSLNAVLGPAIVVRAVCEAPPDFDARRSAVARCYRYTVLNRPVPDPFLAATTWHRPDPLDLAAMRLACDPLIGEHDFSSFCRVPRRDPGASMTRRVRDARWLDLGDGLLRFDIEASSFCHQMVRSIVGTMVDMGSGQRRAGEMGAIVRSHDRARSSGPAPPHGLCLYEVRY